MTTEKITVDIVVVSILEMGFAEGEFATVDTIYDRGKQMGLETCPVEIAVAWNPFTGKTFNETSQTDIITIAVTLNVYFY